MDLVIGLSLANASQILFLLLLFDSTCAIDAKRCTYVVASYHGVHWYTCCAYSIEVLNHYECHCPLLFKIYPFIFV